MTAFLHLSAFRMIGVGESIEASARARLAQGVDQLARVGAEGALRGPRRGRRRAQATAVDRQQGTRALRSVPVRECEEVQQVPRAVRLGDLGRPNGRC